MHRKNNVCSLSFCVLPPLGLRLRQRCRASRNWHPLLICRLYNLCPAADTQLTMSGLARFRPAGPLNQPGDVIQTKPRHSSNRDIVLRTNTAAGMLQLQNTRFATHVAERFWAPAQRRLYRRGLSMAHTHTCTTTLRVWLIRTHTRSHTHTLTHLIQPNTLGLNTYCLCQLGV